MSAIKAHFGTVEASEVARAAVRRTLHLEVLGKTSSGNAASVLIHNLSATGLLIETAADLSVGEAFEVEIPHAGSRTAVVVWASDRLFGCQFESAVTTAAVSAAVLQSPIDIPGPVAPGSDDVAQRLDGLYDVDDDNVVTDKFSLGARMAIIIGLALLAWTFVILTAVAVLS